MPNLSIITVNLNNYEGLKCTIESVISQSYTDFEWIVIDGGSTDGSLELLEKYSDQFSYWCSEPDKGIYNAMNKGIAHAKGEWLQFLNSGDWLCDSNVLNNIFSEEYDCDIVYGNFYEVNGYKKNAITYDSQLTFSTLYFNAIAHSASFIQRYLLIKHPYNEDYKISSDWFFFLEHALKNSKFLHKDVFVSCFNTKGISSTNRQLVLSERSQIIKEIVPSCIQIDMLQLDKYYQSFVDGQLEEIDLIRKKSRFLHRVVTFDIWVLRLLDRLFCLKAH